MNIWMAVFLNDFFKTGRSRKDERYVFPFDLSVFSYIIIFVKSRFKELVWTMTIWSEREINLSDKYSFFR